MKIDKIALISLPIMITATLLYIGEVTQFGSQSSQTGVSQGQKNKALATYMASTEEAYNKNLETNLDNYAKIYQEELAKHQKKIEQKWGEYENSTTTKWVSYVNQGNVRRSVDFDTGNISIEILVDDEISIGNIMKRNMEKQVFSLLNITEGEAYKADEVAKNVDARLPRDFRMVKRGLPSDKRLFSFDDLVSVNFNYSGIVNVKNRMTHIVTQNIKKAKVPGKKIVTSSLQIKKSALRKAERYAEAVEKTAKTQKIPPELIFAIIEAESNFNPMAKSHIPAYGLMQIVPKTAGKDATKHLFGRAKILAPSYLYSSDNNINIGAAYLHVLYYKYLKKVINPESRVYLTIASYNSGTTNVARAFVKKKSFNQAVSKINQMTPDEVYRTLIRKLPYKETRKYLEKVSNKMEKYTHTDLSKKSV